MKYAVYVEGQSEMLFVADILQKYSNYDPNKCGFLCINLQADIFTRKNNPIQGNEESADYYQIVNVNNDNRVISKLNKDIPGLIKSGYNVIIGLKDVYGNSYNEITNQSIVDRDAIERMYTIQKKNIKTHDCDFRLHYAIMEYEAWMLALIKRYVASKGLNLKNIYQELGLNSDIDPEKELFHPYTIVSKIYQACGEIYDKHEKNSLSFLSSLSLEDYESLRNSGNCSSYSKFIDSLLGGVCPNLP